jgi:hypothetical protein
MIFELIVTHPEVRVQEVEYRRLLGYPAHYEPKGRARELAEWARQWYHENGRPWIYARQSDELDFMDGSVEINGTTLVSKRLHDQLAAAGANGAMLIAVSAGKECEERAGELWSEGKPDEYFFLEVYGSAVVECLVTVAAYQLCQWADQRGMAMLSHYSPGYPGWDISDQHRLMDLILQRKSVDLPGDLHVLSTGMLQPKKSLLGLFGITRHTGVVPRLPDMIPCETCSLPSCRYRRAPYRRFLPQIEDVRQFRPQGKILFKA